MSAVFCCSKIEPYRPRRLDHESKFVAFMTWIGNTTTPLLPRHEHLSISNAPYAVQIVRQVNFGAQESIRYFIPVDGESHFAEATEDDLLEANFEKLNSYSYISDPQKPDCMLMARYIADTRISSVRCTIGFLKSIYTKRMP